QHPDNDDEVIYHQCGFIIPDQHKTAHDHKNENGNRCFGLQIDLGEISITKRFPDIGSKVLTEVAERSQHDIRHNEKHDAGQKSLCELFAIDAVHGESFCSQLFI